MRPRWKFNTLGVVIYVILVGWVLLASMARFMDQIATGTPITWNPIVGVLVGLLGLAGIGWGHITAHDEEIR